MALEGHCNLHNQGYVVGYPYAVISCSCHLLFLSILDITKFYHDTSLRSFPGPFVRTLLILEISFVRTLDSVVKDMVSFQMLTLITHHSSVFYISEFPPTIDTYSEYANTSSPPLPH